MAEPEDAPHQTEDYPVGQTEPQDNSQKSQKTPSDSLKIDFPDSELPTGV